MGQAATETLTAHCVMTVPVSFTSDDDGYYDGDYDDNRNDGKITTQPLLSRQRNGDTWKLQSCAKVITCRTVCAIVIKLLVQS